MKYLTAVGCWCIPVLFSQSPTFKDLAKERKLDFVHDHGGSGEKFYVETMGSGCCFIDYDSDGDLDIYFVQGAPLPGWQKDVILENKLFQNEDGLFTDVTGEAWVGDKSYGIGCAVADYDNDGDPDIYVTNFGPDVLYRNNGDGTFADETKAAGIANPLWGSSAAFFDADNDGWLDLYVTNYVEFSLDTNPWCGDRRSGLRAYCHPDVFEGVPDVFFHNNGDGTFSDLSDEAGIAAESGKGLGVVPGDMDNDGDMDIYVANDKTMNLLFVNDGTGNFREKGLSSGVGFNEYGQAEAGMGVDLGDYNRDGWPDLFVTNFSGESNTLYVNDKDGLFTDITSTAGLALPSLAFLGFGTKFVDLDLDGWLDIFVVNGHVIDNISSFNPDYSHAQRKQVFLNRRDGTFWEATDASGGDLLIPTVGRGAAFGDMDNDGDIDVAISNNNGPANLLVNQGSSSHHWIGFLLKGRLVNKDAIGAKITVRTGADTQVAWVNPAGSYLASNDKRVLFGLEKARITEEVIVEWPGGGSDRFEHLPPNHYYWIVQGEQISTLRY